MSNHQNHPSKNQTDLRVLVLPMADIQRLRKMLEEKINENLEDQAYCYATIKQCTRIPSLIENPNRSIKIARNYLFSLKRKEKNLARIQHSLKHGTSYY